MKARILTVLCCVCLAGLVSAQDAFYSIFSYSYFIPKVRINDRAVHLQQNVLPSLYRERSASRDMRWVSENDSAITAFWQQQGDTVLHILREFSGIEWHESEFDIYLVRYFPTIGSSDPVIIPLGGFSKGSLIEAAPQGNRLILNLVFQLARRMLAQANQPEDNMILSISYHPLMRPSQYRLDNLAMLLAFNTCQNIIGLDSTLDAYESAFWKNKFAGREIFEKYLKDSWILAPDQTLADWVAQEPTNSQLVYVTRPPRRVRSSSVTNQAQLVEGLPLKGRLGFSVRRGDGNQLVVNDVDVYRLGYACGLRTDDIIRRVDGRVVRNQKIMVEHILAGLESGGAVVEIIRGGNTEEVLIQPIIQDLYFDDFETDEYFDDSDTLMMDTLPTSEDAF
ncbi:MAG: hypothetical protein JSU74_01795 [Candidatus Zixiibacteriota bacterium]|nr:MAG: hypothetical protein JSU74_01795 [candidate division Zixibacteria bacterium]